MQDYAQYCQQQGIELKIIIDESFRALCGRIFPENSLIYYPRKKISQANFFKKIILYRDCIKKIRSFESDIAFNIEEDSATNHLTRLSGAKFKLGCSPTRHKNSYHHVVPVEFENRPVGRMHRWYSYYEVFAALGMPETQKSYLRITLEGFPKSLNEKLKHTNFDLKKTTIAIHAGATKEYKKWPLSHMASLIEKIYAAGMQPVLLGAGTSDEETNKEICRLLEKNSVMESPLNLCNQFSLVELAQFINMKNCALLVGNDSGPFHLSSALGAPGLVLFGPTNDDIWGPLGEQSGIVRGSYSCDPACYKGLCLQQYRCLQEISPDQVFNKILCKSIF